MRVLITSTPGTGHLHPIVPLARELVSAGHDVVWATGKASCPKVESYGFRAVPCGLDSDVRSAMVMERGSHVFELPPRERRLAAFPLIFAEISAPAMRDDLVAVFDDVQPQLVVHEFAELAAAPMASARGIPHVTVGFSGAVSDAMVSAAAESVAPVWEREGVTVTAPGFNGDLLLHPFPLLLDTPRADGPSAPMRPLSFDGAAATTRPDWIASFGANRPGVYVTFGTEIAHLAPWAAILGALGDLDLDVIATVGGQVDPAALGATPSNTRVERYVPQSFLLERASVVVSHAGAGTLIGTATAGKVHLAVPISADQWDNADLFSAANAGVTLEPDDRDADTIGRTVERLLADAEMRAAAETVRSAFLGMPHPTTLVPALERLGHVSATAPTT